jgi:hypothetical protein
MRARHRVARGVGLCERVSLGLGRTQHGRILMRDVIAALVALLLLMAAASLATTLRGYRRRRQRARDQEQALGRTIVAELPGGGDLVLFSEDDHRFYYGAHSIDKDLIVAVSLLVNGAAIAVQTSRRRPNRPFPASGSHAETATASADVEGFARDRWDVEVVAETGTVVIPCGAIRERVSQDLGRTVFEAIRTELVRRDR